MDPDFWEKLTNDESYAFKLPSNEESMVEDLEPDVHLGDVEADGTGLSINTLIDTITMYSIPAGIERQQNVTLTSIADAENPGVEEAVLAATPTVELSSSGQTSYAVGDPTQTERVERGRGKQKKFPNRNYSSGAFWRHNGGDASDSEMSRIHSSRSRRRW
ncbi:hypothetical protein BDN70DRAFT_937337 [Pholiota conissans]|uniref:Uncharacterized protein n=1 Tax=Pholiota conissans TaxID=109636 RepID=A0A9P5YTC0_9AGAR|nr:hypothetical protein BDN70DRAFT_937337 [Pholiota conissans]